MKSFVKIVILFLCLLLILAQPVLALNAAQELDRLVEEQALLELQWQEAQNTLDYFQSQRDLASTDLAWLLERSEEQQAIYAENAKEVAAITDLQRSLDRNLEVAIMQYEQRKENYGKRIEGMYNLQKKSQLEILLESDSLQGYFTTLRLMKLISDADEQELRRMREAKEKLEKQHAETTKQLEQLSLVLESIRADMAAIENDIQYYESSVANLDAELQMLYGSVQQYSDDHFQLQIDIDDAARRKEQEAYLAAMRQSTTQPMTYDTIYSGSGFLWPCPGHDGVTSEYGSRYVADLGLSDFHTGIDFAAPYGHPTIAAASGTVVFAGWYNEYAGNTVRIDIGSGIVIMYCHLNDILVFSGQYVNAGETVGTVGSTGLSSGPHLHFQVDVGGQHVDPRLYLY